MTHRPAASPRLTTASATPEAVAFSICAAALPDSPAAEWIKLAPLGRVQGRDGRGPYDFGDRAHAASVVAASKAYMASPASGADAGVDLLIDYDHAFDLAASQGRGAAPAAGWIKDLEARGDGIWARVEWTATAAARMQAREYRYVSPTFNFAQDGKVLRIVRAALTNHPNLNLPALAAAGLHQDPEMDPTLKAFLEALGLAAGTTLDAALAHVRGMATATAATRADLDRIATSVGLAAGATADAIATAAVARGTAEPDPKLWVPMATYTATASALSALQAETLDRTAEAAIGKAMEEGKITPANRDHFLKVYKADPAGWTAFASVLPVVVPPGNRSAETGVKPPPGAAPAPSEGETAIFAMMGVDPQAAAKTKAELGW